MKNRLSIIALILITLMFMSGCSLRDFDTQVLIRPPKPTGEKAEIQSAIEKKAGSDINLKYPQRGEYRSAIIMYSILGGENKQAVVFYSPDDDTSSTHVMIVDKVNGTWTAVGDFSGEGDNIDKVYFADINDDGYDEIVVGWSTFSNNSNNITIYSYNGKNASSVNINNTYTDFMIKDMDNDQVPELLLLSLSTASKPASADLLKYSKEDNMLMSISRVGMDPDVIKYLNVTSGKINSYQNGIIIDGKKAGNVITEIVYWDMKMKKLMAPLYDIENPKNSFALRGEAVLSEDINGDGIIDIPILKPMSDIPDSAVYITQWAQYDTKSDTYKIVSNMLNNLDEKYYVTIPETWLDKISIKLNVSEGELLVLDTGDNSHEENMIFKIKTVSKVEWNSNQGLYKDYEFLEEKNNKVYLSYINKDRKVYISSGYVKSHFIVIE